MWARAGQRASKKGGTGVLPGVPRAELAIFLERPEHIDSLPHLRLGFSAGLLAHPERGTPSCAGDRPAGPASGKRQPEDGQLVSGGGDRVPVAHGAG